MKKILILFVIGMVTFLSFPAGLKATEIKWVGCDISLHSFMNAVAKEYEKKTGIKVLLTEAGAVRGIRDVAAGKADMGGTCRHKLLTEEEKGVKLQPVAWDAIVVITHKSNPVKSLTLQEVKDIFSGKITNWKEVGGPDQKIRVLDVEKGKISGVGRMARTLVFKNPEQEFTPDAQLFPTSGPMERAVEKEPWTIAFTGVSSAKKRDVKIIAIEKIEPTYENIVSGKYALYRPLYLVYRPDSPKEVLDFVSFVLSDEGQNIIKREGTVPLKEGMGLWKLYNERMKEANIAPGTF
ncbi:MAG: phosphate ABC transporter substrate-binding protein [Thermodesulfovibrionales bacterium]|nr:phosphate ABC transporter substrate-binding protein [Thermodesulfovibrionales bacterium]